jgi:DnaJ-class molecular chaperone
MGYKGRDVRGKWKIGTCHACGGSGQVEDSRRQRGVRIDSKRKGARS